MIEKYNDVLSTDLIKNIMSYFESMLKIDVWGSSLGWDQSLSPISSNIITHTIQDKILYEQIKNSIETKLKINFDKKNLEFIPLIYVWSGGSYITWHKDDLYAYSGTIYLNEEWNTNDGGIFLYMDNITKKIRGIEPTYNSMIVNSEMKNNPHNNHCVTCIVPGTIKKRITLQWRTNPKQKDKLVYQ